MINKLNSCSKQPHPNISFKQYCQQFVKESPAIKLNKTTYVLGDLHTTQLREKQKEQFKSFIHDHISLTREIRNTAEFDATMYMGLTQKWQRVKQDYFRHEIPLMRCELDMKNIKATQDLNFDSWHRIDQVSQKRARGSSLDTTMRKTQTKRKTNSNSFRF